MNVPLSVLDLSPVGAGVAPSQAIRDSIALARVAEQLGYTRYWFAEHHNMASIATSAPEVLIAAPRRRPSRIRLGAGGIMVPEPRAAARRRGVPHARGARAGPHRPRPRARARHRSDRVGRAAPQRRRRQLTSSPSCSRSSAASSRRRTRSRRSSRCRRDVPSGDAVDARLDARRRVDRGAARRAVCVRRPLRDAPGGRRDRALSRRATSRRASIPRRTRCSRSPRCARRPTKKRSGWPRPCASRSSRTAPAGARRSSSIEEALAYQFTPEEQAIADEFFTAR